MALNLRHIAHVNSVRYHNTLFMALRCNIEQVPIKTIATMIYCGYVYGLNRDDPRYQIALVKALANTPAGAIADFCNELEFDSLSCLHIPKNVFDAASVEQHIKQLDPALIPRIEDGAKGSKYPYAKSLALWSMKTFGANFPANKFYFSRCTF